VYEIVRPSSYTDISTNVFSFGGEQRNRGVEWGFFGSPMRGVEWDTPTVRWSCGRA